MILTKCVIKGSQIQESSPSPDEFYHLPSFGDLDGLGLVFVVGCGEWGTYDFI
jgi:hypothetical protein